MIVVYIRDTGGGHAKDGNIQCQGHVNGQSKYRPRLLRFGQIVFTVACRFLAMQWRCTVWSCMYIHPLKWSVGLAYPGRLLVAAV